ncbi:MAG: bis-aminopropyl spermidine synthase family protein [Candidatus Aenigmatarchaeota archaeon]
MDRIKTKILNELAQSPKSLWEILERSDFLLKDLIDVLKDFYKNGLIEVGEEKIFLTKKGEELVNKKSLAFLPEFCQICQGKKIILNEKLKELLKDYKEIVKERPLPTEKFFQEYMQESDVIARVAFMHYNNDVDGKKIILIGDDDLLSIALALTNLPSRILVLDIDERIGSFLEKVNKKHNFNIEFQKYNVSDPLPKKFLGKFDVFSSEPLETLTGLKAFILRGILALRKDSSGYFGLTHAEASLKKWLEIEKFLTRMNCVITDLIAGFSLYPSVYHHFNNNLNKDLSYENFVKRLPFKVPENKGIKWYKSALFRFEILEKPKIFGLNKKMKIEFVDKKEDITFPY